MVKEILKKEDIKLIKEIKEVVKKIKPLELPLVTDYIIIETDGCKEGWGAVLLCKPNKHSPKDSEKMFSFSKICNKRLIIKLNNMGYVLSALLVPADFSGLC